MTLRVQTWTVYAMAAFVAVAASALVVSRHLHESVASAPSPIETWAIEQGVREDAEDFALDVLPAIDRLRCVVRRRRGTATCHVTTSSTHDRRDVVCRLRTARTDGVDGTRCRWVTP